MKCMLWFLLAWPLTRNARDRQSKPDPCPESSENAHAPVAITSLP